MTSSTRIRTTVQGRPETLRLRSAHRARAGVRFCQTESIVPVCRLMTTKAPFAFGESLRKCKSVLSSEVEPFNNRFPHIKEYRGLTSAVEDFIKNRGDISDPTRGPYAVL